MKRTKIFILLGVLLLSKITFPQDNHKLEDPTKTLISINYEFTTPCDLEYYFDTVNIKKDLKIKRNLGLIGRFGIKLPDDASRSKVGWVLAISINLRLSKSWGLIPEYTMWRSLKSITFYQEFVTVIEWAVGIYYRLGNSKQGFTFALSPGIAYTKKTRKNDYSFSDEDKLLTLNPAISADFLLIERIWLLFQLRWHLAGLASPGGGEAYNPLMFMVGVQYDI